MQSMTLWGRAAIMLAALLFLPGFARTVAARAAADQPASPPEVLIYYANETSPDAVELRSWETILDWLRRSERPEAAKIVGQLECDAKEFPAAVDRELAAFRDRLPGFRPGTSAVIFTNRLVRDGKYLLLRRGATEFEESAIEPCRFDNLILTSNPLASVEMFARCLREVARQFDPAAHRFVLVTKSHGSREMAITPRLVVRAEETSREELLAVATGSLPEADRPAWCNRLGVTKDQYFATLEQLGRSEGMHFALVFMEACNGTLDGAVTVRPPENAECLFMTGTEKTNYRNLDYADLLSGRGGEALSDRLGRALMPLFPMLIRGADGAPSEAPDRLPWYVVLYWLPLGGWLAWVFYVVRRGRRAASHC